MRKSLLVGAAVAALFATSVRAENPVAQRGFRADGVYHLTELDSVDLFSGALNTAIPIGPAWSVSSTLSYQLTLRYTSKVWTYIETCTVNPQGWTESCRVNARPIHETGGLGWNLSFGELQHSTTVLGSTTGYTYVAPDGSSHNFYRILHEGDAEDAGDADGTAVSYTRDGTYLRIKAISANTRVVEFPDGGKHRFTLDTTENKWYLRQIYNGSSAVGADATPASYYVSFAYPANPTYAGVKNIVIQEYATAAGRTHTIRFKPGLTTAGAPLVTSVELSRFKGGTPAIYTFEYQKDATGSEAIVIAKPLEVTSSTTATVVLLSKIVLPSGEVFQFGYSTPATMDKESGTMQQMILPTLGKVEWDYGAYNFAHEAPYNEAVGISARRIYGYSKSVSPQYALEQYTTYAATLHQNVVSTMVGWTDSIGSNATVDTKTIHYFDGMSGPTMGLPFTTAASDSGGRYLSRAMYDCNSAGACTQETASYVRYELDAAGTCQASDPCAHDRNRRPFTENIVSVSDGGRYAATDFSSFDGLGHYRTATTSGNFGTGNTRTVTTDYNVTTRAGSSVGTYSVDGSGNRLPGFTMLNATDPWVLGTYTEQRITEAGVTASVQTCFDIPKNFLLRKRVLKGSTPGVNDLLSVYTPDAAGNVAREESFGGDVQTLSTASLCSMAPPAHGNTSFRIDHTYQHGSLRSSQYKDAAGSTTGGLAFYTADYDVDVYTGLVERSRDAAGIVTEYDYDTSGRLTWVKPQVGHGPWIQYDYRLAQNTPSGRAQVAVYERPNGSTTGVLARNSVEYEGLGHVYRENRLLANNSWNTTDTRYDHAGRKAKVSSTETYVSDSVSPSNWTTTTYDDSGRPVKVTAPDGTETWFVYAGSRVVSRTVQMGTTLSGNSVGNTSVTTSEELDRQGRLWKVTEAAGTSSAVTTEYSYDVGCRLSKVCSGASAGTCAQSRFFNYDRRGLLASEQHPEKGAAGNGIVSYTYDARGHVLTKAEGGTASNFRLGYAYDRAERLIDVRETNRANRLVKQYTFAAANGVDVAGATDYRKGRLESAVRYNYDRPAIAFDGVVTERYEYAGPGGRPSRKVTEVRNGATMVGSFDHRLTYTAHGLPENLTYPDCTAPGSCGSSDPARTVTSSYANGFLTGVNGYATLTYDANGMVTNVAHANGLHTRSPVPPNRMTRPEAITVQDGPSGGVYWTTGTHVYDGAGNVKQIGYDYYVYDRLGRVVEGSAEYASAANNKIQRYGYDAYGNMTSMATLVNGVTTNTRTMGIQTSTNRLCAAPYPCSSGNVGAVAYDEAGNLTTRSTATSTFDSQNMMATLSDGAAVSYVYTAGDERIWAYTSTPSQSSRWWLRGLDGKVLREYATTGAPTAQTWTFGKDYVYRGGPLLAAVANGGAVTHFHLDHLGSTRLITNAAKGIVEKTSYFPFGEESSAAGPETKKFTGHERDYNSASGAHLDYMHARYYSPYWGRFLSVDPKLTIDRNLSEPQRWNRYSYVTNNPLKYVDQDGRDATVAWRIAWVFAAVCREMGRPNCCHRGQGNRHPEALWFSVCETRGRSNGYSADIVRGAEQDH